MNERIQERIDVICSECKAIWSDNYIPADVRCESRRLYADLYEDTSFITQHPMSRKNIRVVIRSYEDRMTKLYERF